MLWFTDITKLPSTAETSEEEKEGKVLQVEDRLLAASS
jgi:hypothetical protein